MTLHTGFHTTFRRAGDRIHSTRLGRWMNVDPLSGLYPNFSPYVFVANNPLFFKDEKGRVIVDSDGNPVTTIISNGGTISATATFIFAEGTSQKVIEEFNNNGAKIINTLIQIKTGNEQVAKAIESSDKIHLIISPDIQVDKYGNLTLGDTKVKRNILKDESGTPVGVDIIIEVVILQGSIDEIDAPLPKDKIPGRVMKEFKENGLNNSQKIGAVATHELEHATNPIDVGALKSGNNISNKQHEVAKGKGTSAANEYGKQNKVK